MDMKPLILKTPGGYMSVKFLLRMNLKMGHLIEHGGYGDSYYVAITACGVGASPVEVYDNWGKDWEDKV